MHTKVETRDGEQTFEAHAEWNESVSGRRPAIVIAHRWAGQQEFEREWARHFAERGYVGVALDVYGKGVVGANPAECRALMMPLLQDRARLVRRIDTAIDAVRRLDTVDPQRVAAVGFCFGGLCVIEFARRGGDVAGVVSIHGLLPPPSEPNAAIRAKVLVLHGHDDPSVPPSAVLAFEQEMTEAGVDWQLHAYGGAVHAFTNPEANDRAGGNAYHPLAAARAKRSTDAFFDELFGER